MRGQVPRENERGVDPVGAYRQVHRVCRRLIELRFHALRSCRLLPAVTAGNASAWQGVPRTCDTLPRAPWVTVRSLPRASWTARANRV
jgi:hypothetical protein